MTAGPDIPAFARPYVGAGSEEQLISATVSFEKLHRWENIFPWRNWRPGRPPNTSERIAAKFKKLAQGA